MSVYLESSSNISSSEFWKVVSCCEFHVHVHIHYDAEHGQITFEEDCIFHKGVSILAQKLTTIIIRKCRIEKTLEIDGVVDSVKIEDCLIPQQIRLIGVNGRDFRSSKLEIKNSAEKMGAPIIDRILFQDCEFGEVTIGVEKINKVWMEGDDNSIGTLNFHHGQVDMISLGAGKFGNLYFGNVLDSIESRYDDVWISNECEIERDVVVRNTTIGKLAMSRLIVPGGVQINNTRFESLLDLSNSILKNYVFNHVTLCEKEIDIILDKSLIDGAVFSNIYWPAYNELIGEVREPLVEERKERKNWKTYFKSRFWFAWWVMITKWKSKKRKELDDAKRKDLREKSSIQREIYRQLKNSMKVSSNYIDAMAFRERELYNYELQLKYSDDSIGAEKIRLWIGRFFGDHGENFIKPIKIGLIANLVFYAITFGIQFVSYRLSNCYEPRPNFYQYTGEYLRSLNPIYKLEEKMYLLNTVNSFTATHVVMTFLDMVRVIILGTCIYYVLKALRKYAPL